MDNTGLGGLPCSTMLYISANGKTVLARKVDTGHGSSFNPVMGLYPRVTSALGLSGGQYTVTIWRADGGPLHPKGGTPTTSGSAPIIGGGSAGGSSGTSGGAASAINDIGSTIGVIGIAIAVIALVIAFAGIL